MSGLPALRLTRELRFGLHDTDVRTEQGGANGFAGNPMLVGIAPFLILRATLSGRVDERTGMLINIKHVDRVLREVGVTFFRRARGEAGQGTAQVVKRLFGELGGRFLPHVLEGISLGLSPYLFLSCRREESEMVRLTQKFEFSAAHRLHSAELTEAENQEIFGRCNNPSGHGHNYELEVSVEGKPDGRTGEVMALSELQRLVNLHVVEVFDHKHLNVDCGEFRELNPTVENIAQVIFGKLKPVIGGNVKLASVRVWETPKTMCECSG